MKSSSSSVLLFLSFLAATTHASVLQTYTDSACTSPNTAMPDVTFSGSDVCTAYPIGAPTFSISAACSASGSLVESYSNTIVCDPAAGVTSGHSDTVLSSARCFSVYLPGNTESYMRLACSSAGVAAVAWKPMVGIASAVAVLLFASF
jgi:hypothetical protein